MPGKNNVDGQTITVPEAGDRVDNTTTAAGVNRETYDQVRACLQVQMIAFGQTLGRRYMAGIPDQISLTEPTITDFENPPLWWTAFTNWQGVMKAGAWRIKYQSDAPDIDVAPVVGWVKQGAAPELWGAITATANTIPAVRGSKVIVRGARLQTKGLRTPNGVQIVDSVVVNALDGITTLYFRQTQDLDLSKMAALGDVRLQQYDYVVPSRMTPGACGIHKRGGPFRRRRGRRSTPKLVN